MHVFIQEEKGIKIAHINFLLHSWLHKFNIFFYKNSSMCRRHRFYVGYINCKFNFCIFMLLQNFYIKNSCNLLINEYFAIYSFLHYWSPLFWIQWFPKTKLTNLGSQISACFATGQWAEKTFHGRHSLYSKCYFFGFSFCNTDFCNFSLASEINNRQRYELWTAFIKEVPFCTSYFTQRCILINFCSMTFRAWNMCKIFSLVPSKKPPTRKNSD